MDKIKNSVDIVEVHNGRAVFQNRGSQARVWALKNNKVMAASSDAHGVKGLATTYTMTTAVPDKDTLLQLLQNAQLVTGRPPLKTLLYPKAHALRKRLAFR